MRLPRVSLGKGTAFIPLLGRVPIVTVAFIMTRAADIAQGMVPQSMLGQYDPPSGKQKKKAPKQSARRIPHCCANTSLFAPTLTKTR